MSNIAIYARKSTESEDRQILSIDSQVRELKEHAQREGLVISRVLIESKSAKAPGRPVFNELFTLVQSGRVDGVLCWKLDRLARNPVDGGAVIWAIEERKLATIYTPQRAFTNTSNDKFWMQLEFGMAKKYVDDLSDNVKRGLRAKIAQGWLPGLSPLGYVNDQVAKTIIKDPERFLLIRKMWDLMLTGNYSPAKVLHIATTKWGLRTRKLRRVGGGPMAYSAVYKMFANPFYYGVFVINGALVMGSHEPMISKEEFDRVQGILHTSSRPRPQKHTFAFTGQIRCGECGAMVTAEHKINRQGHQYVYYHCTKRKRSLQCRQRVIQQAKLEQQISNLLASITISKGLKDWTLDVLNKLGKTDQTTKRVANEALEKRRDAIAKELTELVNIRLRGLLGDSEFVTKKIELESERTTIEQKINEGGPSTADVRTACRNTFDFACSAKKVFDSGSQDVKRDIFSAVGSNPALLDGILRFSLQKPLSIIQGTLQSHSVQTGRFEPSNFGLDKAKTAPCESGSRNWLTLVKDVRTFYLENPTAPTMNQAFERSKKRTPPDPAHIREFKQYEREQTKERRAVARLFRVYQRRVQSPDMPVPRKRTGGRSVPSPSGPRSGSSSLSDGQAPTGSGCAAPGNGTGGGCLGAP